MITPTTYEYAETDFPNKINAKKFQIEIQGENEIVTALNGITVRDKKILVSFKDALSAAERQVLGDLIAAHDGKVTVEEDQLQNPDGRNIVHSTSRKFGTRTTFIGRGDDTSNPWAVGGGQKLWFEHKVGEASVGGFAMGLNTIVNESYLHEGYIIWKGWQGDSLTMKIVPKLTPYTPGTNTNYLLYGGYLVLPSAGEGNIDLDPAQIRFVEVPINEKNVRSGAGYWDCDVSETGVISNPRPNPNGTGVFNIFTVAIDFDIFMNEVSLVGDGFMELDTDDASYFPHNTEVKFVCSTNPDVDDHEWSFTAIITAFRKRTA